MSQYEMQEYREDNYGDSNIIIMDEIPEYDKEDYDLMDPKSFKKYVEDIERTVRHSFEYTEFIQYLRKYMDMNKCAFFKNISNADTTKIKIHLHHHPFTLFDIAMAVYGKRYEMGEPLEVELVAKEVMYIHYFLYVGLVPLAETVHVAVHQQALFVPLNIVLGKYDQFIDMYSKWISEEAMDRFHTYEELTKHYNEAANTAILQAHPVYLKLPGTFDGDLGAYGLPQLNSMLDSIKQNLKQLKNPDKVKGILVDTTYDSNSLDRDENGMIKPFIFLSEDEAPNLT